MSENSTWKDSHPEIGALWVKEGKGQKFMSGHISLDDGKTKQRCVIYSNKYKTGNAPDFRIYLSPEMNNPESNNSDILDSVSTSSESSSQKEEVSEELEEELL